MHLSELCTYLPSAELKSGGTDQNITHASAHSGRISAGGLFAALPGSKLDGHDFITDALEKGAQAILSDRESLSLPKGIAHIHSPEPRRDYARICAAIYPARPGMLVGVTGTNGKTSIVEYMRQIWKRATWPAASIGTLGVACPVAELASSTANLTTPAAEDLFALFHNLAKSGITHAAFEASSHGLDQDRMAGLGVNVAVFTNLSQDHLDWHGDMDAYLKAKSRLFFENLLDAGTAILNADDPAVMTLKEKLAQRDIVVWTVGVNPEADFCIRQIDTHPFGLDVQITARGEAFRFPVALSGTFQAVNAVMAAAAAYASGMPLQDSFGALPALTPVRGRMQPVHGHPAGARIIIDFAHTPDALEVALDALRAQTPDRLKVVFGCGGDRDKTKRQKMGAIAARLADEIIITDDNPRSEDPAAIRAEIRKGCPDAHEISPRDEAIKTAIAALGGGDTLLIAGKGHETSQMIGTETLPFDDASVARHALSQLGERQAI